MTNLNDRVNDNLINVNIVLSRIFWLENMPILNKSYWEYFSKKFEYFNELH